MQHFIKFFFRQLRDQSDKLPEMHCFTMSASFVPVGPYKSYSFHIAVKSSILSDVKYDKHSSYSNGVQWY